jgi:hypothetical protein
MIDGHGGQPFDAVGPSAYDDTASAGSIDDSMMELLLEVELARGIDRLKTIADLLDDEFSVEQATIEIVGCLAIAGRLDEAIALSQSRLADAEFEEKCLVHTAISLGIVGDVDTCDDVLTRLKTYKGVLVATATAALNLAEQGLGDEALMTLSSHLPSEYLDEFAQLVTLWEVLRTDVDEAQFAALIIEDPRFRSMADEAIIERRVELLFESGNQSTFDRVLSSATTETAEYAAEFRYARCSALYDSNGGVIARINVEPDHWSALVAVQELGFGYGLRTDGIEPRVKFDNATLLNTFFFQAGRNLGTARRLNELRLQRKF